MNAQEFRSSSGGRIDRSKPVTFTFDGKSYGGYAGDTFASPLLANGVRLGGRSFKYHPPPGVVIGAGPAGLAAALAVGRTGARVVLADEQQELGGSLLSEKTASIDGKPAAEWLASAVQELGSHAEVKLLTRTTAFAYYDHNAV